MVNIKEAQEWQRLAAMDLSTAEYRIDTFQTFLYWWLISKR